MTSRALLDTRQTLARLIRFNATSRNSNLALIDLVQDYLDGLGVASDLVFDTTGAEANLFATIGPPDRPGLAFSYDEELGCNGVPSLLDDLNAHLPAAPFGCMVGEPTGMRVANGYKGKAGYVCTVTGLAIIAELRPPVRSRPASSRRIAP